MEKIMIMVSSVQNPRKMDSGQFDVVFVRRSVLRDRPFYLYEVVTLLLIPPPFYMHIKTPPPPSYFLIIYSCVRINS